MARPITQIIQEVRQGQFGEEASEALARVVEAVNRTRKKGSVTLTLNVLPDKAGDEGVFELETSVTTKVPSKSIGKSIFFMDANGQLTRTDPRQTTMDLKSVPGGKAAIAG